jgi:hypothetical protein
MSSPLLRLSMVQRQCLPENVREHLTAVYAEVILFLGLVANIDLLLQNDSLAKQVKGLKAKNNELIREHVEMVKDKVYVGIQLQNQRLDIKRLTSLQSIHAARAVAESYVSKTHLDEKSRPSLLNLKSSATEMQTASDRRASSFFAIDQISDELAQVAIRSLNIENIEPSRSPQIYDDVIMKSSSASEKIDDAGKKMGKLQTFSGGVEVKMNATEFVTANTKLQSAKAPKCSALIQAIPPKQKETQAFDDDAAQDKPSRQRSQVNYKEARFWLIVSF